MRSITFFQGPTTSTIVDMGLRIQTTRPTFIFQKSEAGSLQNLCGPLYFGLIPSALRERESWGGCTDPKFHQPDNFRYLVHAIKNSQRSSQATNAILSALIDPESLKSISQSIDLLKEPERFTERVSLSCSLIDQGHRGVWEQAGIIIEAPKTTVIMAAPYDLGSANNSRNMLLENALSTGIAPPDELLRTSQNGQYNEVVVLPDYRDQTAVLKGFFYVVNQMDQPVRPDLAIQIEAHAKET